MALTTNPLDLSQYISGVTNQAYTDWGTQNDQMQWAKDQFAKNSGTADTVSGQALDTSAKFQGYSDADRNLYDTSYVPAMKQQLDYAENYITPDRMAANRAAAGATVATNAATARAASERALQSTGVDPSSGRFAGLDAGLAADAAAKSAAAMTTSDRTTEQLGQQYLDNAIKTGAVLPGQSVNEAGLGISAGNQAVNAPLAATASGAATMGTPMQWNAAGNAEYNQWPTAASLQTNAGQQQQQLDLNREKFESTQSSGAGALIGAGMGVLGSVAGAYFGGPMGASIGGSLGSSLGKGISGTQAATGGMIHGYAEGGAVDDEDMSDQYNTHLDPDEEQRYHDWAAQNHREGDTYDYDMRGAFHEGIQGDPRTGHYPDTYKKPNHPTFSDESRYDGAGGRRGGHWEEDETGSETLQPYGTHSHVDGGSVKSMIDRFANGGDVPPDPAGAADDGGSNYVPPEASPSGGAKTDDVHAMLNEGEFVMPKDVTSWYGEKFMQNLIQKARKEAAGPKAEGQPGPPVQAMALSPPSFRSEGARMGA